MPMISMPIATFLFQAQAAVAAAARVTLGESIATVADQLAAATAAIQDHSDAIAQNTGRSMTAAADIEQVSNSGETNRQEADAKVAKVASKIADIQQKQVRFAIISVHRPGRTYACPTRVLKRRLFN